MTETDEEFMERADQIPLRLMCFEDATRLRALARRGAEMQWRPISEAPTEGQRVLLFTPPYGAGSGHHFEGMTNGDQTHPSGWKSHFCVNKEAQPTHFMPLPPPPEGEKE